ncbi:hypothetical protein SAMN05880582_106199 [Rhizobium sp. RU20A]|uniref:MmcQ/YjbR family DNA-binding protein n=1 Tax=Rhizobium sp. RU20A TaxID=1907412 RepID=UPI0009553DE8|nr:MmcQ/YjbR family DNA-binding protein [Rhizobium sp. RU20A]SIR10657.1 hypothetical protein SAMN05880582_106199 [Rhizobium sp. RU20A]
MLTLDDLRAMILVLPDTVETSVFGNPCFKVGDKAICFWNVGHDSPVFKVSFDERDMLIEAEPETFFTTPHHRPSPLVLARPQTVDPEWARATLERTWRRLARRATVTRYDEAQADTAGRA